jgi:hypothetical protein
MSKGAGKGHWWAGLGGSLLVFVLGYLVIVVIWRVRSGEWTYAISQSSEGTIVATLFAAACAFLVGLL